VRYCSKCKEKKNLDQFAWKNKAKGTRSAECKACHKIYRDKHYRKNKDRDIIKVAEYKKKVALIIRQIKESSPCSDCQKKYPYYVMDFDHVRGQKSFNIGGSYEYKGRLQILEEIKKCDLVCSNCHRERTQQRRI